MSFPLRAVVLSAALLTVTGCATMEASQNGQQLSQADLDNMSCDDLLKMQAAFQDDSGMVSDILSVFTDLTGQSTSTATGLSYTQRRGLNKAADMVMDQIEKRKCGA